MQLEQYELSAGPGAIQPRVAATGEPYGSVRILVRLHSYPIGFVDAALPADGLDASRVAEAIDAQVGSEVCEHLIADGLPPAKASAIGAVPEPRCQEERRAVLADPPEVSVVVPTRDRPESLRRSLDAILDSSYPSDRFEVVVADNAPTDSRTRDLVEQAYEGRVAYVLAPRPGSASARNDGAARASGELVAFTDDDVVVDRNWLVELVTGFRVASGVACVTGLVVPSEIETWGQALFEEYGGFTKGLRPRVRDMGEHRPDDPLFPFNAAGHVGSGNNVAFRRSTLLELGGYDPDLGNGTPARAAEDWELFLRILRRGHAIAYRPGAIAHHAHRRDLAGLRLQVHDYGMGLTAALTRTVVRDPTALLEIARRIPAGARWLLSSGSAKNQNRSTGYPRELRRSEWVGMARGPVGYVRSRVAGRRYS